ncbi:MAG: hypothetical protein R2843_12480 [Thermomicrobiales bacterium]
MTLMIEPGAFIMTWKMLKTLKRLAETHDLQPDCVHAGSVRSGSRLIPAMMDVVEASLALERTRLILNWRVANGRILSNAASPRGGRRNGRFFSLIFKSSHS